MNTTAAAGRTFGPPSRLAVSAAALLLAAMVVGCGGGQEPTDAAAELPVGAVADPQRVCDGFAAARFAVDTTRDAGPQTAYERAQVWLHPDHRDRHPANPGRDHRWATWVQHQVVVEVDTEPYAGDALGLDDDTVAYRAVLVSATPAGEGGWRGATQWHTVTCALAPDGDQWRITDYHIDSSR